MIPRSPEERPGLLAAYAAALREEPKLRFYVLGALIDDIGVACSIWVFQLIMVNLFTDQGQRAHHAHRRTLRYLPLALRQRAGEGRPIAVGG